MSKINIQYMSKICSVVHCYIINLYIRFKCLNYGNMVFYVNYYPVNSLFIVLNLIFHVLSQTRR